MLVLPSGRPRCQGGPSLPTGASVDLMSGSGEDPHHMAHGGPLGRAVRWDHGGCRKFFVLSCVALIFAHMFASPILACSSAVCRPLQRKLTLFIVVSNRSRWRCKVGAHGSLGTVNTHRCVSTPAYQRRHQRPFSICVQGDHSVSPIASTFRISGSARQPNSSSAQSSPINGREIATSHDVSGSRHFKWRTAIPVTQFHPG